MKATRFQRLSGTYLVMAGRTTCRACYHEGKRGAEAWVIDPMRCPSYGGPLSGRWHRAIVAAASKHYAEQHPAVVLPI